MIKTLLDTTSHPASHRQSTTHGLRHHIRRATATCRHPSHRARHRSTGRCWGTLKRDGGDLRQQLIRPLQVPFFDTWDALAGKVGALVSGQQTRWWARQDSNLQLRRYERRVLTN
jgi:hypothetical protein